MMKNKLWFWVSLVEFLIICCMTITIVIMGSNMYVKSKVKTAESVQFNLNSLVEDSHEREKIRMLLHEKSREIEKAQSYQDVLEIWKLIEEDK